MKLLVIVNYQFDFIDGSLGFPTAKEIEDKIVELIPNYDDFFFVVNEHDSDYLDTFEGKMLPVKHCIKDSTGSFLYGKLKEYKDKSKMIFKSNTFASFELGEYLLKHNEYTEIDICGLVSHMDILANAVIIKSALPNSLITVRKDASRSFDKSLEQKAYNILNALQIEVK